MKRRSAPERILLVTGLSGAGKSTALRTLEDLGWEVVDNLPLSLLEHLLSTPLPKGRSNRRRFSETRRRHPLAPDRPAADGIAAERELMAPLRRWADHIIDTTDCDPPGLQQQIRQHFGGEDDAPTLTIMSFGFARGVPRNADIVLDVRFLRNPHWEEELRPLTGLDEAVAAYVAADENYDQALGKIEDLLLTLLPRYQAEGKSYVSVAFGCTGGRHRSVQVAEYVAAKLRAAGFSPTVEHRDLSSQPRDGIEDAAGARSE
jgi:UPF0042 nucleotide-binding protein